MDNSIFNSIVTQQAAQAEFAFLLEQEITQDKWGRTGQRTLLFHGVPGWSMEEGNPKNKFAVCEIFQSVSPFNAEITITTRLWASGVKERIHTLQQILADEINFEPLR